MKTYRVSIPELHYSHREVELPEGATNDQIIEAALREGKEMSCEYSNTLTDSNPCSIDGVLVDYEG